MKKFLSLLLCAVFSFGFCACGDSDIDPDKYVGEAQMTRFKALFTTELDLYSNVFALSTLDADKTKSFEYKGDEWAPVKSASYSSYKKLSEVVGAAFISEAADKLLKEYDFYADIDGKFCIKTGSIKKSDSDKPELDISKQPKLVSSSADECVIRYYVKVGKLNKSVNVRFVKQNGSYKLSEFVNI